MIYIVQDLEGNNCGVYKTLEQALPMFKEVYTDGLRQLQEVDLNLVENEDPFFDCDTAPQLQAWTDEGELEEVFFQLEEVYETLGEESNA